MRTAFFYWPAGWASGHAAYQSTLLNSLLAQDRHRITVIVDADVEPPPVAKPHDVVTYRARVRPLARFTVRDYGVEIPAARALRDSRAEALIANGSFVAPRPRHIPVLSIFYEADFFEPVPWHWFDPGMIQRMAAHTTRSLADAAAVFGISEHTVGRIVDEFGVDSRRAIVACPAIPATPSDAAELPDAPTPYVAQVGWFHPRKEMPLVLASWIAARKRGLPHDLVLIGRPGPYDRVLGPLARQVRELAGPHAHAVRIAGHVPRPEYLALLKGADLVIAGSRHEGFCIPVVEAFAMGTPVVAVDRTALSEVAGSVGRLAAANPDALATQILAAVAEPPDPAALRAFASTFTPAAQARPYLDVLDALEERRWPATTTSRKA